MSSIRIAMVAACPFPYPRGTPARIFRLAEALTERGHDVHVVTYHLGLESEEPGFPIHRIRSLPFYRRLAPGPTYQKLAIVDTLLTLKLRRLLRRERFDIVHAHHFEGLLSALAACRRSPPIVFEAHTLLGGELPYYNLGLPRGVKRWLGRTLDRRLSARADAIIAVSERIRDTMVDEYGLDANSITVVPGGVELDLFSARLARSSGQGPGADTLIYTGTLAPYQGIELMLEAFADVRRRRRQVRLLLATDSSFEPYEALAARLGVREHIDLVSGKLLGLRDLLAAAQVALNPRVECDGYPQKLLNYMAAGKPIVSFAGSAADLREEEVALLVEGGDPKAFAAAILDLLDDPDLCRRLGANALAFVSRERSWERTAQRTEHVYRQALERMASPRPTSA